MKNNDSSSMKNNEEDNDSKKPTTKKNLVVGMFLMILSSVCVCFGQMFWKLSNSENIVFLAIGFLLYGLGAISMIFAYRFGELSKLHPILSLNYPISIVIARIVFKETINILHIVAIALIMLGVCFIATRKKI